MRNLIALFVVAVTICVVLVACTVDDVSDYIEKYHIEFVSPVR